MEKAAAEKILSVAMSCSRRVDESIARVEDACHDEVYQSYRRLAGRIMGYIYSEIIEPIWTEHPDLAPRWFCSTSTLAEDEIDESLHTDLVKLMDDIECQVAETRFLAAEACSKDAADRYVRNIGDILDKVSDTKSYLTSLRVAGDSADAKARTAKVS